MSTFDTAVLPQRVSGRGAAEVNAIITVTAAPAIALRRPDPRLPCSQTGSPLERHRPRIIIVDVSGSMEGTKIREARRATGAAIACIGMGPASRSSPATTRPVSCIRKGRFASSPNSRAEATAVVGGSRPAAARPSAAGSTQPPNLLGRRDRGAPRHSADRRS